MKTEYEYLRMIQVPASGKTSRWFVVPKSATGGEGLGEVKWYGAWRQYCYFPIAQAVYSAGCLNDIAEFLKCLQGERRGGKAG